MANVVDGVTPTPRFQVGPVRPPTQNAKRGLKNSLIWSSEPPVVRLCPETARVVFQRKHDVGTTARRKVLDFGEDGVVHVVRVLQLLHQMALGAQEQDLLRHRNTQTVAMPYCHWL